MTSPDGAKPSGAYTNFSLSGITRITQQSMQQQLSAGVVNSFSNFGVNNQNFQAAALDEFGAMICRALAGIEILGLHPLDFLNAWATNLDAQARQALTSAQTAQATATSAVAAVQNQQQQAQTGGAAVTLASFPQGLSGSLGPGWNLGGTSTTAPWGTTQYGAGLLAQTKSPVAGIRWALSTTTMETDNHQASTVCAYGNPNSSAFTSLVVRAAPDMSSFVYANIFIHSAYIGYGQWNGSTWNFSDWGSISSNNFILSAGDSLTLSATGTTYSLTQNSNPVLSHTDSTSQVPTDSGHRGVGLLSSQYVDGWGNVSLGWQAGSFTATDTQAPATIGTGWSIYRSSTTGVTMPGTGWQFMGAGTFDTQRNAANATITDLGLGIITIQKTGWYSVSFAATMNQSPGTSSVLTAAICRKPSGGTMNLVREGTDTCGTPVSTASVAAVIYCQAGDQLQPAYLQSGPFKAIGDANGYLTYFDGALVSS